MTEAADLYAALGEHAQAEQLFKQALTDGGAARQALCLDTDHLDELYSEFLRDQRARHTR